MWYSNDSSSIRHIDPNSSSSREQAGLVLIHTVMRHNTKPGLVGHHNLLNMAWLYLCLCVKVNATLMFLSAVRFDKVKTQTYWRWFILYSPLVGVMSCSEVGRDKGWHPVICTELDKCRASVHKH